MKQCCGCSQLKTADQFYRKTEGGLRSRCISCYAVTNRQQHVKHQEKRIAYERSRGTGWSRTGREKWDLTDNEKHDRYLRRTYKISLAEYETIFASQGHLCAICRGECNRSTTDRLCVDHDHDTGRVRGLLCFQCNVGLGKFKDDPGLLSAAMEYLKR